MQEPFSRFLMPPLSRDVQCRKLIQQALEKSDFREHFTPEIPDGATRYVLDIHECNCTVTVYPTLHKTGKFTVESDELTQLYKFLLLFTKQYTTWNQFVDTIAKTELPCSMYTEHKIITNLICSANSTDAFIRQHLGEHYWLLFSDTLLAQFIIASILEKALQFRNTDNIYTDYLERLYDYYSAIALVEETEKYHLKIYDTCCYAYIYDILNGRVKTWIHKHILRALLVEKLWLLNFSTVLGAGVFLASLFSYQGFISNLIRYVMIVLHICFLVRQVTLCEWEDNFDFANKYHSNYKHFTAKETSHAINARTI